MKTLVGTAKDIEVKNDQVADDQKGLMQMGSEGFVSKIINPAKEKISSKLYDQDGLDVAENADKIKEGYDTGAYFAASSGMDIGSKALFKVAGMVGMQNEMLQVMGDSLDVIMDSTDNKYVKAMFATGFQSVMQANQARQVAAKKEKIDTVKKYLKPIGVSAGAAFTAIGTAAAFVKDEIKELSAHFIQNTDDFFANILSATGFLAPFIKILYPYVKATMGLMAKTIWGGVKGLGGMIFAPMKKLFMSKLFGRSDKDKKAEESAQALNSTLNAVAGVLSGVQSATGGNSEALNKLTETIKGIQSGEGSIIDAAKDAVSPATDTVKGAFNNGAMGAVDGMKGSTAQGVAGVASVVTGAAGVASTANVYDDEKDEPNGWFDKLKKRFQAEPTKSKDYEVSITDKLSSTIDKYKDTADKYKDAVSTGKDKVRSAVHETKYVDFSSLESIKGSIKDIFNIDKMVERSNIEYQAAKTGDGAAFEQSLQKDRDRYDNKVSENEPAKATVANNNKPNFTMGENDPSKATVIDDGKSPKPFLSDSESQDSFVKKMTKGFDKVMSKHDDNPNVVKEKILTKREEKRKENRFLNALDKLGDKLKKSSDKDKKRGIFGKIFGWLKTGLGALIGAIPTIISGVFSLGGIIITGIGAITGLGKLLFKGLGKVGSLVLGGITELGSGIVKSITGSEIFKATKDLVVGSIDNIAKLGGKITTVFEPLTSAVKDIAPKILGGLSSAFGKLGNLFGPVLKWITGSGTGKLIAGAVTAGVGAVKGFITKDVAEKGIVAAAKETTSAISEKVAKSGVKEASEAVAKGAAEKIAKGAATAANKVGSEATEKIAKVMATETGQKVASAAAKVTTSKIGTIAKNVGGTTLHSAKNASSFLFKEATSAVPGIAKGAKAIGETFLSKGATAGARAAAKGGGKLIGETAKTAIKGLKAVPMVGSLISAGFAAKKLYDGDLTGAAIEMAGAIPGLGLLTTAGTIARDISRADLNELKEAGIVEENIFGNDEVLDWAAVENLGTDKLQTIKDNLNLGDEGNSRIESLINAKKGNPDSKTVKAVDKKVDKIVDDKNANLAKVESNNSENEENGLSYKSLEARLNAMQNVIFAQGNTPEAKERFARTIDMHKGRYPLMTKKWLSKNDKSGLIDKFKPKELNAKLEKATGDKSDKKLNAKLEKAKGDGTDTPLEKAIGIKLNPKLEKEIIEQGTSNKFNESIGNAIGATAEALPVIGTAIKVGKLLTNKTPETGEDDATKIIQTNESVKTVTGPKATVENAQKKAAIVKDSIKKDADGKVQKSIIFENNEFKEVYSYAKIKAELDEIIAKIKDEPEYEFIFLKFIADGEKEFKDELKRYDKENDGIISKLSNSLMRKHKSNKKKLEETLASIQSEIGEIKTDEAATAKVLSTEEKKDIAKTITPEEIEADLKNKGIIKPAELSDADIEKLNLKQGGMGIEKFTRGYEHTKNMIKIDPMNADRHRNSIKYLESRTELKKLYDEESEKPMKDRLLTRKSNYDDANSKYEAAREESFFEILNKKSSVAKNAKLNNLIKEKDSITNQIENINSMKQTAISKVNTDNLKESIQTNASNATVESVDEKPGVIESVATIAGVITDNITTDNIKSAIKHIPVIDNIAKVTDLVTSDTPNMMGTKILEHTPEMVGQTNTELMPTEGKGIQMMSNDLRENVISAKTNDAFNTAQENPKALNKISEGINNINKSTADNSKQTAIVQYVNNTMVNSTRVNSNKINNQSSNINATNNMPGSGFEH